MNVKVSKYKCTTKSDFVFSIWFVVSVLHFVSVYKIKELKAKFGLVVSYPKLFAVFSQTDRNISMSGSGGSSVFTLKFTAEQKFFIFKKHGIWASYNGIKFIPSFVEIGDMVQNRQLGHVVTACRRQKPVLFRLYWLNMSTELSRNSLMCTDFICNCFQNGKHLTKYRRNLLKTLCNAV